MRDISILIAGQLWLMDERVASMLYSHFMSGRLDNSLDKLQEKSRKPVAVIGGAQRIGQYVYSTYKVKHKSGQSIAVMPVVGTLTKRGDLCSYGMRDYMNEIALLNENEDIAAIVMDMEGPGGTVDGTPEFGLAVKQSKKPIVTFGDNMVASANYWVASHSDWIIGNKNNPTEFGSIGVLCVHEYWGKFIEDNIGEVKIIRAPQSVDKARINPIEELTPEIEEEIKDDLKTICKDFIGVVKKGRGSSLKEGEKVWGTGKMFKNSDALDMGLIDAIGTLGSAIDKAAELANGKSITTKSNKSMTITEAKRKVSSFFKPKKAAAKAAEEQPAAAEDDNTPMWTEDLVFNTDGSGDGAFCLHPDDEGNDRKFETKIDNNQGNEPPTDPAVTEDDNWAVVAQEEEEEAPAEGGEGAEANTTISKMNASLKKANATIKKLSTDLATVAAENAALKQENAKLKEGPAGKATTVVADGDPDKTEKKQKHRTSVDDEVDQYVKATTKSPKQ